MKIFRDLSVQKLIECIIVVRVRPRTSTSITDLLLPQTSTGLAHGSPSKKSTPKIIDVSI